MSESSGFHSSVRMSWRERLACDVPASFVVFLVALPLSMGIAIASGAPVTSGLVSGIVGGIVAGALAGSPLQVSGPAAGLTVVVFQCIQNYGIEELGVVVLLAGGFQVLAGVLRLGPLFRAVSPAVVQGMLAGIGVLIVGSQFHVMVDDKPQQSGVANLLTIPDAIGKITAWSEAGEVSLDRAARTRLLKQTAVLHLKQAELAEQVHHLLTGVGVAPPIAESDNVPTETGEAGLHPTTRSLISSQLRKLAPGQEAVLAVLRESAGDQPSPEWDAAREACTQALSHLETGGIDKARASQDRAAQSIAELRDSLKSHRWAASLGVLTIVVLLGWQVTSGRHWNFLPAPLVAVIAATIAAVWFDLPVLYVEVPDDLLEEIYLPSLAELKSLFSLPLVMMAVQVAVVASAETLLCATAVDQLHQGPRTRYDKELVAQGIGNMICGVLAALPITGVIVRSSANIQAGAKTRTSTILHGVWLMMFVAGLSFALRMIPTASLAAILVYTGFKLVNPKAIRSLLVYGRSEVAIYAGTLVAIVLTDLLTGVLIGIGLSVARLVHTFSRLRVVLTTDLATQRATLALRGSATFLRLPRLAQALEQVAPGAELHLDVDRLIYIDPACLDLLTNWQKQHELTGGKLLVDWNQLTARSTVRPRRTATATISPRQI